MWFPHKCLPNSLQFLSHQADKFTVEGFELNLIVRDLLDRITDHFLVTYMRSVSLSHRNITTRKKNIFTWKRRNVQMSVNFQPRPRSDYSSGAFGPTFKYPSVLHFCSPNLKLWSPAVTGHLVRWKHPIDRPFVFEPRDVDLYFLTVQTAFKDDRLVLEHSDVVIQANFELRNCNRVSNVVVKSGWDEKTFLSKSFCLLQTQKQIELTRNLRNSDV